MSLEAATYSASVSVDLHTVAKTLHAEMLATNDIISKAKDAGGITPARLAAWRAFRDAWSGWYAKSSGSTWDSDNADTQSVLTVYGNQLTAWKKEFARFASTSSGGGDVGGADLSGIWLIAGLGLLGWYFGRSSR